MTSVISNERVFAPAYRETVDYPSVLCHSAKSLGRPVKA
jgi:hypothetical protein